MSPLPLTGPTPDNTFIVSTLTTGHRVLIPVSNIADAREIVDSVGIHLRITFRQPHGHYVDIVGNVDDLIDAMRKARS